MPALVDTNVLVYRYDHRDGDKQRRTTEVLRAGIMDGSHLVAHQSLIEFVAATTRPLADGKSLLTMAEATREVEEMMLAYTVLYPTDELVRLALRGAAAYGLPWFDAHIWAYAEHHRLGTLLTEDFQTGRTYGTVTAVNPFAD